MERSLNNIFGEAVWQETIELASLLVQMLAVLPVRLLLMDKQSRVLAATDACLTEVLHQERAQVLNQMLPTVLGVGRAEVTEETMRQVLAVQSALDCPLAWQGSLCLPGQSLSWQVRVQPLISSKGEIVASALLFEGLLRDVARLEQEERHKSMDWFANGLLHEVKNIMQNSSGMAQVLKKRLKLEGPDGDGLDVIRYEQDTASRLLAEYMSQGNLDSLVGEFSLNDAVQEVLTLNRPSFRVKGIELLAELDDELPRIWMDKQRIKQVLINCLDNCREAISQRCEREPELEGLIVISTQLDEAAGVARLLIEDNGIGLSDDQLQKFFKPYYTTKKHGTGLGTSLSESIVRLHGGKMLVDGALGEGCRVTVELPLQGGARFHRDDFYAELTNLML